MRKRIATISIAAATIIAIPGISLGLSFEPVLWTDETIVVSFFDGGTLLKTVEITRCDTVARPTELEERDGYIFSNWFTSTAYDTVFDFDQVIEDSLSLFGLWQIPLSAPNPAYHQDNDVVKWEKDDRAKDYTVYIGDKVATGIDIVEEDSTISVSMDNYVNGIYTIGVVAIGEDGYANSEKGVVTFHHDKNTTPETWKNGLFTARDLLTSSNSYYEYISTGCFDDMRFVTNGKTVEVYESWANDPGTYVYEEDGTIYRLINNPETGEIEKDDVARGYPSVADWLLLNSGFIGFIGNILMSDFDYNPERQMYEYDDGEVIISIEFINQHFSYISYYDDFFGDNGTVTISYQ